MSLSEFFAKVSAALTLPPPTQHDLALKAMAKVAEGAHRKLHGPRRPKRNLHRGELFAIGEVTRAKKGGGMEIAKTYYQPMIDASRYPVAHDNGAAGDPNRRA